MDKIKIAIIGGGATGLYTAALLNDTNADITIFEKNNKLGKKILASGNGKCNFSNIFGNEGKYNDIFANNVISKYTIKETLDFFSKQGLIYKNDDQGRCYPISECASSVLDCLKGNLNKIKIKLDCTVEEISFNNNKCIVKCKGNEEYFDYIVCCSGSVASNLGSVASYMYLKNLNIGYEKNKGSLTPIIVKENVKSLSGVRVKCVVTLFDENNDIVYKEQGEVIFKDDGLSGIVIFNISSYINRNPNKKYSISIDLSNGLKLEELKEYFKNKNIDNLFKGFLNDKIGEYISIKLNINEINQLSKDKIDLIVRVISDLRFSVHGLYSLKDSQVCSGGILVDEVDENLKLKKYPYIYIGGELLNVDGVCGGYNLQFAWSCGGVIASDIKRRLKLK